MSDIRFNQWLHNSGTGGVSQVDGGHVGIGTTNPEIAVHSGNNKILNVGVVTASTYYGDGSNLSGIQVGGASSLSFNDNIGAYFGNSQDLKIHHDGNHSYIDDQGTGNLRLRSGTLEILNLAGNKTSAIFSSGGGQTLNFNNSQRFVTTNTGAVVTGILTATASLNVKQSGNAYLNLLSTGTGNAGIYMDASDGDIAGSDYCSIYQKNDLDLAITNRKNTANIIFETGGENERLRIASNGNIGIGNRTSSPDQLLHVHTGSGDSVIHVEAAADPKIRLRAHSGESIVQFADASSSNVGEINYVHSGDYLKFRVNASDRMLIDSGGHLQLQHGLTALSGGGVIVCAAKSSSGTANQSNYKVDFVVPMGDLGTKKEYEDIRAQFSSGQTGKDWTHALGGSGILIATVQNNYYWGFRTKIYHITTYGNSTNNVTQLNLLHNYSAAGHGANSAAVDLAVQSHDGKTPKLRATFSGDYWNSNVLTVTYIGSAVASTGNIRQTTTFDSKLTGQDTAWK